MQSQGNTWNNSNSYLLDSYIMLYHDQVCSACLEPFWYIIIIISRGNLFPWWSGCDRAAVSIFSKCFHMFPATPPIFSVYLEPNSHLQRGWRWRRSLFQKADILGVSQHYKDFVEQTHHMDSYWTLAGIPLRRLELCGCRVGATGAQRLAEALRNPQGAGAAIIRETALEI